MEICPGKGVLTEEVADSYCSNLRRRKKKSLISKLTKNFSVCDSVNNVYIK